MKIQHEQCPLCKSEEISPFLTVPDFSISKETFKIYRCKACSFTFTQDPPAEEVIGPYYSSEVYISHSDTNKGLINRLYHIVRNIMLGKKRKIISSRNKGRKLLDVGSGTGYFLHYMKERNYETMGVEVSEDAKKTAIGKFGLDIRSPQDLVDGKLGETFDVITLWHVLEHLYGLEKYMKALHNSLKDDGLLAIAVPNCSSSDAAHYGTHWAAYDVPRHLWHFTPATMEKLARQNGFTVTGMKRLPFDAFYNAMLSEKYKDSGFPLAGGFIFGFISYLNSLISIKKSSSIVYLLKKTK